LGDSGYDATIPGIIKKISGGHPRGGDAENHLEKINAIDRARKDSVKEKSRLRSKLFEHARPREKKEGTARQEKGAAKKKKDLWNEENRVVGDL